MKSFNREIGNKLNLLVDAKGQSVPMEVDEKIKLTMPINPDCVIKTNLSAGVMLTIDPTKDFYLDGINWAIANAIGTSKWAKITLKTEEGDRDIYCAIAIESTYTINHMTGTQFPVKCNKGSSIELSFEVPLSPPDFAGITIFGHYKK